MHAPEAAQTGRATDAFRNKATMRQVAQA